MQYISYKQFKPLTLTVCKHQDLSMAQVLSYIFYDSPSIAIHI